MSHLVVVAFKGEDTAHTVRDNLVQMQKERVIELDDLVVVVRQESGKVKIEQAVNLAGAGALSGSFWGLLIGMLFWAPWLGMAVGAAAGAISGHFTDIGIDDQFIKEVAGSIDKGHSAVFLLIRRATADKVLDRIEVPGKVIQTSLSNEDEAKLRAAFGEA